MRYPAPASNHVGGGDGSNALAGQLGSPHAPRQGLPIRRNVRTRNGSTTSASARTLRTCRDSDGRADRTWRTRDLRQPLAHIAGYLTGTTPGRVAPMTPLAAPIWKFGATPSGPALRRILPLASLELPSLVRPSGPSIRCCIHPRVEAGSSRRGSRRPQGSGLDAAGQSRCDHGNCPAPRRWVLSDELTGRGRCPAQVRRQPVQLDGAVAAGKPQGRCAAPGSPCAAGPARPARGWSGRLRRRRRRWHRGGAGWCRTPARRSRGRARVRPRWRRTLRRAKSFLVAMPAQLDVPAGLPAVADEPATPPITSRCSVTCLRCPGRDDSGRER